MTTEEMEARKESMTDLHSRIITVKGEAEASLWKLAAYLDLWDDNSGWSALGYEKLTHWLADPEISMTKGRFYDLIGVYRELKQRGLELEQMAELEHSKVRIALPAVKSGRKTFEEAIDDVKTLGARDLRDTYREPTAPDKPERSDAEDFTPPPVNDGNDTPVLASESDDPVDPPEDDDGGGPDPTGLIQPLDPEVSGVAPEDDLEGLDDDAREVVEGTATETASEPAQNPSPTSGQDDRLLGLAKDAQEWLKMAQESSSDVVRMNALDKASTFVNAYLDAR